MKRLSRADVVDGWKGKKTRFGRRDDQLKRGLEFYGNFSASTQAKKLDWSSKAGEKLRNHQRLCR